MTSAVFDRDQLLGALDDLGAAALAAGSRLEIAIYGGSALMLAGNFRFSTEDVDIAAIERPWPQWLAEAAARVAARRGWANDWLNDAVTFHLSAVADPAKDHILFGTFPRRSDEPGLVVHVPTADYILALKLKAIRVADPVKGPSEALDIVNLVRILGIATPEDAVAVMARYFPVSARNPEKQLFLLRQIWTRTGADDAPEYPRRGDRPDR